MSERVIASPSQTDKLSSSNNPRQQIFGVVLAILIAIGLCTIGILITGIGYESYRVSENSVITNRDDSFVVERANQFDLPQVIPQYDQVINAIENYHQDYGVYPQELSDLVPDYLSKTPGIYIRRGERLTYSSGPEWEGATPFTFYIYGHYPGLASMHGWYLQYCPQEFELCNNNGDRHTQSHRINDRWVWINSSAL